MLQTLEISPAGEPSGSVVWLHGLGASGHDFESLVPILNLPSVRFVFPHAPERSVTLNGGFVMPAWYDLYALDERPNRESPSDVAHSARAIEALLNREIERGLPANRVILAGFSQGAAMALHVGLRYPATLAGILCLSGYLMQPEALAVEAHPSNRQTPILMCHGTYDPTVRLEWGERSRDALVALSPARPLRFETFSMGHEVCMPEIATIGGWFRERLGLA